MVINPIELTHQILVTDEIQLKIKEYQSHCSDTLLDLLLKLSSSYKSIFGFEYPPIHDPSTIAYIIDP